MYYMTPYAMLMPVPVPLRHAMPTAVPVPPCPNCTPKPTFPQIAGFARVARVGLPPLGSCSPAFARGAAVTQLWPHLSALCNQRRLAAVQGPQELGAARGPAAADVHDTRGVAHRDARGAEAKHGDGNAQRPSTRGRRACRTRHQRTNYRKRRHALSPGQFGNVLV